MARAVRPKPQLRQLQKANTRQRILDAARRVFFNVGYYDTTVDQIVDAAGASRQTFYFHFTDKERLLAQLVVDYNARGVTVMERIPGVRPTLEQLRNWLLEVAVFLEAEKSTYSVLSQLSFHPKSNHAYYVPTAELWVKSLARSAPAFAVALTKDAAGVEARARAWRLYLDITWAGSLAWEQKGTDFADAVVTVAAESLHEFLHDPRFRPRKGRLSANKK